MIWNPWRRIRELEALARKADDQIITLGFALDQSHDRYDRVLRMNNELRDTLALYREAR